MIIPIYFYLTLQRYDIKANRASVEAEKSNNFLRLVSSDLSPKNRLLWIY
jgi:hypothetical protein